MHTDDGLKDGLELKIESLRRRFRDIGSAVLAFSGGVDSSVLVAIAHEELGEKMVAVTAVSASFPAGDRFVASKFCTERSIPHAFIETDEFTDEAFLKNPDDRCYHCKRHLYATLVEEADRRGFRFVVEGTNSSDLGGHRPGHEASKENARVATPLIDCGLAKDDVRAIARSLDLPSADKPAAACLASRVPTGMALEPSLLLRIDGAEDLVRNCGVKQVRVRHHGDVARIEVDPKDMAILLEHLRKISTELRSLGWKFVTMDLSGYRTGGMRE